MNATLTLLLCAFLIATPARAQSQSTPELTPAGHNAYNVLVNAPRFNAKHVGYSGDLSPLVEAYLVLAKEPSADLAFKSLLREGTLCGQLYALCGLFFTDPDYVASAIEPYRGRTDPIVTQSGCFIRRQAVREIIEVANPIVVDRGEPKASLNRYLVPNSGQPLKSQAKRAKPKAPPATYQKDILHGGYSGMFLYF